MTRPPRRIAPGLRADLLLADGDPLADISRTLDIHAVARAGNPGFGVHRRGTEPTAVARAQGPAGDRSEAPSRRHPRRAALRRTTTSTISPCVIASARWTATLTGSR